MPDCAEQQGRNELDMSYGVALSGALPFVNQKK